MAQAFLSLGNSKYPRGGGTVREQFENSSGIQFVISLRTVPEWGMKRKGRATSSSSVRVDVRSRPIFWEAPVHFEVAFVSASKASLHDPGG